MTTVVIGGQFSSLSEAQWREITESLAKRGVDLDAETVSKLAEIPGVVIEELRAAIEAVCAQPTRSEMAKRLAAVRKTRQFDDTDPNTLGLIEPNFSDRQRRTPEQVRKLADKALRDLRRPSKGNKRHGKGNKRYYPQPDGIDPATKCALIVSIKLNWPAPRNRRTQAMCEALYAAVGGDVKRRGGTPNRAERDGFWRDHLRMAQSKQWRDTLYSRTIERALTL